MNRTRRRRASWLAVALVGIAPVSFSLLGQDRSAEAQISLLEELSCPVDDPRPTTIVDYLFSPDGPRDPVEALNLYLSTHRLDVPAELFVPVDIPVRSGELVLGVVEPQGLVAIAILESRVGGTWWVTEFSACYSFELANRTDV